MVISENEVATAYQGAQALGGGGWVNGARLALSPLLPSWPHALSSSTPLQPAETIQIKSGR
jgi:hypothetical protein